jgi:hypothetical protein
MDKGFLRRLVRPLVGALGFACLAAIVAVPGAHPACPRFATTPFRSDQGDVLPRERPSSSPGWWDVSVSVSVKGEYTVRGAEGPIAGVFTYRARWTGRLELDSAGDFLLVHLGTEVLDWRLRETGRPGGHESILEATAATKPALRMEYLLKDGRDVEFVFGLGTILVPLHEPRLGLTLELPRTSSRQPGWPGRSYGDFVCGGSCRVAIPEADFTEAAPERRFSWDWRREKTQARGDRVVTLTESHAAEAVVTVIIH